MKLYLLGAANPETVRILNAVRRRTPNIEFPGLLDNNKEKHGNSLYGIPILGGSELIPTLANVDTAFVSLVTGSTLARYETGLSIIHGGGKLGNLIHPSVDLTMTRWGVGNYIQEGVIVQAEVQIGDNTSIHMGSLIGHETKIGNSCFIAHGVSISGCCQIGDGTFIGTNATILPRVTIGQWVTIGAGSVVNRDIPDFAVAVGNPARIIKMNQTLKFNGAIL